jgi:hypothetical protein
LLKRCKGTTFFWNSQIFHQFFVSIRTILERTGNLFRTFVTPPA